VYAWTIPTPNPALNASAGSGSTITQTLINRVGRSLFWEHF
jgi:hypothetical protein